MFWHVSNDSVRTASLSYSHVIAIIHGKKAPENSMQYMASVQDNNGHHVCGGFLITEEFVVSAAQCDDSPTHVVLGNHNLKNGNHQKIKIENKLIHENYQHVGLGNDIMLIKLSEKVKLGHGVEIIQIPHAEINLKENQVCQVAGWGTTKTHGKPVDELMVVDVSVIDKQVCKEQWPDLPANVTCAGGYKTNKGFCQVCFLSFQFKQFYTPALKSLCAGFHLLFVMWALCSYLNTKRMIIRVLIRIGICVGVWGCSLGLIL
uniref:trypsin n=1 Tax=Maylandia zebra TaxID=106582 RepID=A0A3P9BCC1_9CICH